MAGVWAVAIEAMAASRNARPKRRTEIGPLDMAHSFNANENLPGSFC